MTFDDLSFCAPEYFVLAEGNVIKRLEYISGELDRLEVAGRVSVRVKPGLRKIKSLLGFFYLELVLPNVLHVFAFLVKILLEGQVFDEVLPCDGPLCGMTCSVSSELGKNLSAS